MATVTGLTYEQARAKQAELKAQGKTASTSKEYGKLEDYIKTLKPENYGAETVASAQKKLSTSTQVPQISSTANPMGTSPISGIDLNSYYDKYFNTPEAQVKKDELAKQEKARDEAITGVQDNPWYSQSTRGGKIAAITSDSERNLARVNNELNRLQSDAQIQYNIQLQQYDINRQAYQDSLNLFSSLVQSGALTNASGEDVARLSVQTGIPTSMINSIVETSKVKSLSLQTLDDGNNQYVVAIDPNGNVVNKTFLGASKSSSTTDPFSYLTGGGDSTSDPYGYLRDVIAPPQSTGVPGSIVESPIGSGIYWEADSQGRYN